MLLVISDRYAPFTLSSVPFSYIIKYIVYLLQYTQDIYA